MTGIELIAEERRHQIEDKGYNAEWVAAHPWLYADGQFKDAACLTIFGEGWIPENWPDDACEKLALKRDIDALKVAGAFCAAEIDRLQSISQK